MGERVEGEAGAPCGSASAPPPRGSSRPARRGSSSAGPPGTTAGTAPSGGSSPRPPNHLPRRRSLPEGELRLGFASRPLEATARVEEQGRTFRRALSFEAPLHCPGPRGGAPRACRGKAQCHGPRPRSPGLPDRDSGSWPRQEELTHSWPRGPGPGVLGLGQPGLRPPGRLSPPPRRGSLSPSSSRGRRRGDFVEGTSSRGLRGGSSPLPRDARDSKEGAARLVSQTQTTVRSLAALLVGPRRSRRGPL